MHSIATITGLQKISLRLNPGSPSDSILDHRGLRAPTDSEEFEWSNRRGCSHDFEYAEVNMCKYVQIQQCPRIPSRIHSDTHRNPCMQFLVMLERFALLPRQARRIWRGKGAEVPKYRDVGSVQMSRTLVCLISPFDNQILPDLDGKSPIKIFFRW